MPGGEVPKWQGKEKRKEVQDRLIRMLGREPTEREVRAQLIEDNSKMQSNESS